MEELKEEIRKECISQEEKINGQRAGQFGRKQHNACDGDERKIDHAQNGHNAPAAANLCKATRSVSMIFVA